MRTPRASPPQRSRVAREQTRVLPSGCAWLRRANCRNSEPRSAGLMRGFGIGDDVVAEEGDGFSFM